VAIEVAEGISGSLGEATLTDLLRILAWNGRSGALLLWDGTTQVGLFFEQGLIVRAQMTEPVSDAIEGALLLTGKVGGRQLERMRRIFRGPRQAMEWRALRLLAAEGLLTDGALILAQEAAIRETMRRALTWTRGDLQFKPGIPPIWNQGLAALNVEEQLINGLRELDERGEAIVTPRTVVRWAPAPPRGLTAAMIGLERWRTLNACDGRRSAAEVATVVGCEVEVAVERIQWLLDRGAVLAEESMVPLTFEDGAPGMPMEDRLVVALSRYEPTFTGGRRLTRGKAAATLIGIVNTVAQAYLEHWRDLVREEARERVWQLLVLPDLEHLVTEPEYVLGMRTERNALRDGQVLTSKTAQTLQAAAEREPGPVLQGLARLVERALLMGVGEVDRPVSAVDSFESVTVFLSELQNRLATIE
jgi:hypothetical protein